jgi:hypothetical protein
MMVGENLPTSEETFEIPEASPEGVKNVFDKAVRFLNLARSSNHVSPSETQKEVDDRKAGYLETFRLTIEDLDEIYPDGNWEQRAREEVDRRFQGST